MNAIEFIRASLESGHGWVGGIIADMKDAPLTRATANGGNHPMWILGHITYSEANLINKFCQGIESPLADWREIFGMGTEPSDDASIYPAFEDVLGKFEETRAATLAYLDTLTEDDLDKSSHAPEEMQRFFGTVGHCLKAACMHYMFHGGQAADARRAAGRPVLMG